MSFLFAQSVNRLYLRLFRIFDVEWPCMPWVVATAEAPNDDTSGTCPPEFKCAIDDSTCLKDASTAHRRRIAGRRCSEADSKVRRTGNLEDFNCGGYGDFGGKGLVIRRGCGLPKGFPGSVP